MTESALGPYVPRILSQPGRTLPGHWETDGTLVFADVSGFTRLTERLSKQGKIGAEEIVQTISAVFTTLLSTSAGDGGDVLKFSGDAMLLFYDGPGHAVRASHAALTMQGAIRDVGGIDSSVGRVRLRMSVGLHSGRFSFFCCGGEHLELFVLGEAASATVVMEAEARAGEVLATADTAALLHGARLGPARRGGVPVRAAPTAGLSCPPVRTGASALDRFVAPPLRQRLVDGGGDHEHRRATVAFVGFGGVDDVLRTAGPERVFRSVQGLTVGVMAAAEEYGVLLTATDVGQDGGKFMLTAGAPDAVGDEEARMLRLARRVVELDRGLGVRVGVNAGSVFVGAVGAPFRRTYSTMGAATNLAARVMGRAGWGEVLATAAVTARTTGRFAARPVPAFMVKGSREPLEAAVVTAVCEAGGGGPADPGTAPLIGRDDELATLEEALRRATQGAGSTVEVVGAAGAGKSRLLAELRAAGPGARWVTVACDPYERTSPYHAARLLLRRLLEVPADADPRQAGEHLTAAVKGTAVDLLPWVPLIAVPLGAAVEPTQQADEVADRYRRVRTHEAVCDLLATRLLGPLVVALEDAEHMDDASAELVAAVLARVVGSQPWLAVVTRSESRDGLHTGRGYDADVVTLGPLGPDAAGRLVAALAERTPVAAHLLPQLTERAAGNPLFLAELVAAQAGGAEELPRSVEAIVAARIDRLAPDDRRALRHLSVLGDRFSADLIDVALGPLGVHRGQTERWRRLEGFVVGDGADFAFRNALVRQVAYEGLAYRRRRELHGRVADALTGMPERAAQLPLHLTRAQRWEEAWDRALEAAERARHDAANAVAGELYEMALTAARHIGPPADSVARAAARAGEVWERAGVWQRALDAYRQAVAVTADPLDLLLLEVQRARVHQSAGRYPQALRLYARVRTALRELPASLARDRCDARACVGYATVRLSQGQPASSIEHGLQALAPAERSGDHEALARACHVLDRAYVALGEYETAARYRDQALPVFAALGDLPAQGTVLHDLGSDAQRAGRLEEALWLYERSHEVRSRAGDVVRAAGSANAIGEVLLALGRDGEAESRFAEALRSWRGARFPRGVNVALCNLGRVALQRGAPDRALPLLAEARAVAVELRSETLLSETSVALGETFLALGRFVEAWEAATDALTVGGAGVGVSAHRVRAQALAMTGGHERAEQELEAAGSGAATGSTTT